MGLNVPLSLTTGGGSIQMFQYHGQLEEAGLQCSNILNKSGWLDSSQVCGSYINSIKLDVHKKCVVLIILPVACPCLPLAIGCKACGGLRNLNAHYDISLRNVL